jgi:hypothetical protein
MYESLQPVVVISCAVFQHLLEEMLPEGLGTDIRFLDYGLHLVPNNLTATLQKTIDSVEQPSQIVLGYGLCGNGLNGIEARQHTLVLPRADDCISILMGSYETYLKAFKENPGTYYLTKGWLESGSDPLKEHHRLIEKYGRETADWLMNEQYRHYKKLVFIAHTQQDLDEYRPRALEVADYCRQWGMEYSEMAGSDAYIAGLVRAIKTLQESNDDFLVIPPGGTIRQIQFMRQQH